MDGIKALTDHRLWPMFVFNFYVFSFLWLLGH